MYINRANGVIISLLGYYFLAMKNFHLQQTKQVQRTAAHCRTGAGTKDDASPAPRFSIITATFNACDALLITSRSLEAQTCKSFEWLITDGASTDGTLAAARGLGELVTILMSEPDTGVYNAWNKMLPHSRGEWVLFLGAGDVLYDVDTLAKAADALDKLPLEITTAYGGTIVFDAASGIDLCARSPEWRGLLGPWGGARPWMPCHQGVFQRATVFRGFRFDERCHICADAEPLLGELLAGRGAKLDLMVARFDAGGISSQPRNRLRMVSESVYINWKLGIFHVRPFYQMAVVFVNGLLHPWRVWRTWRKRR
ncbi:glycosyltransferase [Rhodanobacter sp. UC4450_H17]